MDGTLKVQLIFTLFVVINTLVIPRSYKKIYAKVLVNKIKSRNILYGRLPQTQKSKSFLIKKTLKESAGQAKLSNCPKKHKKHLLLSSYIVSLNQDGTKTERRYIYIKQNERIHVKERGKGYPSAIYSFWG